MIITLSPPLMTHLLTDPAGQTDFHAPNSVFVSPASSGSAGSVDLRPRYRGESPYAKFLEVARELALNNLLPTQYCLEWDTMLQSWDFAAAQVVVPQLLPDTSSQASIGRMVSQPISTLPAGPVTPSPVDDVDIPLLMSVTPADVENLPRLDPRIADRGVKFADYQRTDAELKLAYPIPRPAGWGKWSLQWDEVPYKKQLEWADRETRFKFLLFEFIMLFTTAAIWVSMSTSVPWASK